jgi:hypothetical protein
MTANYTEQREQAYTQMEEGVAFAALSKQPIGGINFTYSIDEYEYPSEAQVPAQLALLLGHHIRQLSELFGVDESAVIELAMETSAGFESD